MKMNATNENINIENSGLIQGRGQAAFDGGRVASNGSSGVRFFNGSGEAEATVTGSVVNSGTITAEVDVGFLGGYSTWRVRRFLQRKPDFDPPWFWIDFLRNSTLFKGFDLE